jgi:hypothetical protein
LRESKRVVGMSTQRRRCCCVRLLLPLRSLHALPEQSRPRVSSSSILQRRRGKEPEEEEGERERERQRGVHQLKPFARR